MSDGAKTGTPTPAFFIGESKKWLESLGSLSDGEVCGKLADLLAENYHAKQELVSKSSSLTEALKVAGEALDKLKQEIEPLCAQISSPKDNTFSRQLGIINATRAALERLKSKTV